MSRGANRFSTAIAVALLAVPATYFPAQAQTIRSPLSAEVAVVGTITETGVVQKVTATYIGMVNAKKELITIYIDKSTKFIPRKPAVNDKVTATGQPEGEGSLLAATVKVAH